VILGDPLFKTYQAVMNFEDRNLALLDGPRKVVNKPPTIPKWISIVTSSLLFFMVSIGLYCMLNQERNRALKVRLQSCNSTDY